MKKHKIHLLAGATLCLMSALTGCNDSFLERYPIVSISPEAFFKNTTDLELYTNTYYTALNPYFTDYTSDNYTTYSDTYSNNNLIRGSITADNCGGWADWGTLRKYNILLDNVHKATGDAAEIAHHIGLTRLMRATWYYQQVKWYNDVPWYSHALTDTDTEELYKPRDSRELVVDSIMADLDYAAQHVSTNMGNRTLMSKWYALAMQARICLHEGTFRKYHDELELQGTADRFLQKAVDAASEIMASGLFEIDKTGGVNAAYQNLFTGYSLASSKEIILFKDYDNDLRIRHGAPEQSFNKITSFSRSLMESYEYLDENGTAIPFSTLPGHETMDFVEVFNNRDPRMAQTFMYPGYMRPGVSTAYVQNMELGGYPCIKFMVNDAAQLVSSLAYTDLPICRYAEVLLIYAEAKAELGQLTQEDMDKSVNLIRERVDMPRIVISEIKDDPNLEAQYPGITDKALLQIRRERRIELVNENFRWDDLMRWKEGHLIREVQQGIYIDRFGVFDVTGDGVPDVGIFKDAESNTVPEAERGNYVFYYLESGGQPATISLSEDDHGYIVVNSEIGNRHFEEPKYYYWPIPKQQRVLNPALEETIFW